MVERASSNGVMRTHPVETTLIESRAGLADDAPDLEVMCPEAQQHWNNWLQGHLQKHADDILDPVAEMIARVSSAIRRDVAALEVKLAEARGALGALNGKALNFRGAFKPDVRYERHDVAMSDGSSWVATRDNPDGMPGNGGDWRLLASAGKRGARGERGERGPGGADWVSTTWDDREHAWIPRMSDGTQGPPIPFKALFYAIEIDAPSYSIVIRAADGGVDLKLDLRPMFKAFVAEVKAGRI
jgi:hypothetical protein